MTTQTNPLPPLPPALPRPVPIQGEAGRHSVTWGKGFAEDQLIDYGRECVEFGRQRALYEALAAQPSPAGLTLERGQIINLISPLSNNSADHDIEFAYRVIAALQQEGSAK